MPHHWADHIVTRTSAAFHHPKRLHELLAQAQGNKSSERRIPRANTKVRQ